MLDYLVTSKARRVLLGLLFKDGAAGSVQELAEKANVRYAAAHRELNAMEKTGLALAHGDGRAVVFEANQQHPCFSLLRQMLLEDTTALPPPTEQDDVLANLKKLGAPLQTTAKATSKMRPEETLVRALTLSHSSPTVLRVLPLVFAQLASQLDMNVMKALAKTHRRQRSLGFVLDLAATLSKNESLKEAADSLVDKRVKTNEPYFTNLKGRFAEQLARQKTPTEAKRWKFYLNMPTESFRALYNKYAEVS